jgi:hypothetical protein
LRTITGLLIISRTDRGSHGVFIPPKRTEAKLYHPRVRWDQGSAVAYTARKLELACSDGCPFAARCTPAQRMLADNGERTAASVRCEPSDTLVRYLLRAPIARDREQPIAPSCHKYRRFRHGSPSSPTYRRLSELLNKAMRSLGASHCDSANVHSQPMILPQSQHSGTDPKSDHSDSRLTPGYLQLFCNPVMEGLATTKDPDRGASRVPNLEGVRSPPCYVSACRRQYQRDRVHSTGAFGPFAFHGTDILAAT